MTQSENATKKIVVVGGGGQAKVVIDVLLQLPLYEVIGFIDDNVDISSVLGIPRIGKLTEINEDLGTNLLALGLGHVGNPSFMKRVVELYTEKGFIFETVIAPSATVSRFAKIGKGVVVAAGAVIQPSVEINDYSIVNTNASVDHDTTIGAFTHIAPGVAISGAVKIGNSCLVGTGASVIQGVTIANDCIIGAGAAVIGDCLKNGRYVGVPAVLLD